MKYDVVIVGAGPAGSTAAKFLSEDGFKVFLIDKDRFPRDKPCGGGLPIRVLKRFKYIRENDLIESYLFGGFVHSPSLKYKVQVQKDEPVLAMVLRKKFDFGLVKLAIDNGAVFSDGKTVKDVKISKNKVEVIFGDGTGVDSQVVIGADGVRSIVSKKLGLHQGRNRFSICVFQEYNVGEETLDRFFGENRCGHIHTRVGGIAGYGWVFPKKQHLNIGIGQRGQHRIKTNLLDVYKNYIKTLEKQRIIPENLGLGRYMGGSIPGAPLEKTYANRGVVIGDAAGLVNPMSGEGIHYAMYSAEIAAQVITESLEIDDTSEQFLSKYEVNWKKEFGKDIEILLRPSKKQDLKQVEKTEKLVKFASRDKKLADLVFKMLLTDQLNVQDYKWKILRCYLCGAFRDLFIK